MSDSGPTLAARPVQRLMLTTAETAQCLGLSERTIRYLVEAGELKPVKLAVRGQATALRFKMSDLWSWVEQLQAKATESE